MGANESPARPPAEEDASGSSACHDWRRTGELRWYVLAGDGRHILQREWLHADRTTKEWRDVPFVYGPRRSD